VETEIGVGVEVRLEKVEDVWEEAEKLAAAEYTEIEERRRWGPDWKSIIGLNNAGVFQALIARVDGRMIGYFTWLLDFDIESKGTLIANQTMWYVEPGHPRAANMLFDAAVQQFKKAGVEYAYLHHTVKGRGARLGRFFERKNAELLGFNYVLNVKAKAKAKE
jgi:hypothetical protein